MSDGKLAGRVAIVTGGSRGLGQAIAWEFANEGADVAVVGRDENALVETVDGIEQRGGKAVAIAAELREVASIPGVFDKAEEALGESTILVNSAGVQGDRPALDVTEEQYDEVADTNMKALVLLLPGGRQAVDRSEERRAHHQPRFYFRRRRDAQFLCLLFNKRRRAAAFQGSRDRVGGHTESTST